MIAEGLLWFDDDPRRPLQEKIANAIERYSERTGWLPTVCETNPAQAESFLATHALNASAATAAPTRRRASAATPATATAPSRRQTKAATPVVALPPKLRVTPNATLRPNYFLVGAEPGERLRKAPSQSASSSQRKARRAPATASAASEPAVPSSQPPKASKAPKVSKAPRAKAS